MTTHATSNQRPGADDSEARLEALRARVCGADFPELGDEVNNHVHTVYSFSPYTPSDVAFEARAAGLRAVGSVDHDSIAAADEMTAAGAIVEVATTTGCELRVDFDGSFVSARRLNNPDSVGIAYIVFHGVPAGSRDRLAKFLRPLRDARVERTRSEVAALNRLLQETDASPLNFDRDVLPLTRVDEGGTVTERHVLYALADALQRQYPEGERLLDFLASAFDFGPGDTVRERITDESNPHRTYDLLGALKATFLPRFFVHPGYTEAISAFDAVSFAWKIGAIPAYAYLGDVEESPTGDKKAEQFEDAYLDTLFFELKRIGFRAVTYMPPRNTKEQLARVRALCEENRLMEISGVDINSSRQSFHCPEVLEPEFRHLNDSTWALIAHERLAAADPRRGLFGEEELRRGEPLCDRLPRFAEVGRALPVDDPVAATAEAVRRLG